MIIASMQVFIYAVGNDSRIDMNERNINVEFTLYWDLVPELHVLPRKTASHILLTKYTHYIFPSIKLYLRTRCGGDSS